jgi:hypothetical protein
MLIEIYEQYLKEIERRMVDNPEAFPRRHPDGPRYFGDISYIEISNHLLIIDKIKQRYKENNQWKTMDFWATLLTMYAEDTCQTV